MTAGVARSAGTTLTLDVFTGNLAGAGSYQSPNLTVGWCDGSGHSYANFAHGLDFSENAGTRGLYIFEDGVNRGAVGAGFGLNTIYRVRIALTETGAEYAIQGGGYARMGGDAWTSLTPTVSSSATTTLHPGFAQHTSCATHVGDVRVTAS